MPRRMIGVLVACTAVLVGMAGVLSTRPSRAAGAEGSPPVAKRWVLMKLGPGVRPAEQDWRRMTGDLMRAMSDRDGHQMAGIRREAVSDEGILMELQWQGADAEERLGEAIKRLKEVPAKQGPSGEQREKRARELASQIEQLEGEIDVLVQIANSQGKLWPDLLTERIRTGETEKQRLEMEQVAKEFRLKAIQEQMERLRAEGEKKLAGDMVTDQLKRVVDLRSEELMRTTKLAEAAQASIAAVAEADQRLVEARVRLAERAEQVRQSSVGEVLSRLSNEVAMLAVDLAEAQVRLKLLEAHLPPLDLSQLSEEKLKRLSEQYRGMYARRGSLPPLYEKLDRRLLELLKERASLLIEQVREVTDAEGEEMMMKARERRR